MPFVIGENVGPYRLLEQLGQGGMATVFKAYHAALDRDVAIKALHPAFTHEPNFLARFQREAQVVARLEHPNIVPIYDFAEHEGRPYLVMKFIPGETLKARLAAGRLDWGMIDKIVQAIGAALSYAHSQGILHRDVKPSNVLLAEDGRIYLADFGLARMAEAGESTLSADVMLGTPQYISPEQAMGLKDLDSRADIYSFGVVLYELTVGKVPFSADTPYSIIHDHIYAPLPLPHVVNSGVPPAVERVLLKALAKDRNDRFADIDVLLAAWRLAYASIGEAEAPGVSASPAAAVPPETSGSFSAPPIQPRPAPVAETGLIDESRLQSARAEAGREAVQPTGTAQSAGFSPGGPSGTAPTEAPSAPAKKKSRRRWLWIVFGLMFICVCLPALIALIGDEPPDDEFSRMLASEAPPAVVTEGPLPSSPNDTAQPAAARTPRGPLRRTGAALPLETAIANITASPQSPGAYLDLAAAYLADGRPVDSRESLAQAIQLADEDAQALTRLGDQMAGRDFWLAAAALYLEASRSQPDPLPSDLSDKLNRSIYLAVSGSGSEDLLDRLPEERFPPELAALFAARHVLYTAGPNEFHQELTDLKESYPYLRETALLEAEVQYNRGLKTEARQSLEAVAADQAVASWARAVAQYLLEHL